MAGHDSVHVTAMRLCVISAPRLYNTPSRGEQTRHSESNPAAQWSGALWLWAMTSQWIPAMQAFNVPR